MRCISRTAALIGALLGVLLLSACGGGGGGDGGGGASGGTGFRTTLPGGTLQMTYPEGDYPYLQFFSAVGAAGAVVTGGTISGTGLDPFVSYSFDVTTGRVDYILLLDFGLVPGTYTGEITLFACRDEACTQHVPGSPRVVPYVLKITPRLKVSPTSTTLFSTELGYGNPQTLQVILPQGATRAATSVVYAAGASNWLQIQNLGTSLVLTPTVAARPVGTYQAWLNVSVADATQALQIPVSLQVGSGIFLPPDLELTVDNSTLLSATMGSSVVTVPGSSATTWSAVSSQPWFVLDNTSGAVGGNLAWHLDVQKFAALPSQATHSATVTVSASGVTPHVMQVAVHKQVSQIEHIDELALVPGQGGPVLLYGAGFDAVVDPAASVQVSGGVVPQSVERLSDRLMKVTLPALVAGTYDIKLAVGAGLGARASKLRVLSPSVFTAQAVDVLQGNKGPLVWDSVRHIGYTLDSSTQSVERMAWNGTAFEATSRAMGTPLRTLGFDRERSTLLVVATNGTVYRLDPYSLATQGSFVVTPDAAGSPVDENMAVNALAVSGDNRIWVSFDSDEVQAYDLDRGTSTRLSYVYGFYGGPFAASSRDGRYVYVSGGQHLSPSRNPVMVDALTGTATPASEMPSVLYHMVSNHAGSRWISSHKYVMRPFTDTGPGYFGLAGYAQLPSGWVEVRGALSRSGTRAYVYAVADSSYSNSSVAVGDKMRVYVFDTTSKVGDTYNYTILGYIPLAEAPSCTSGTGCSYNTVQMAVAEDDQTVLLVGNRKFIALPVPAGLQ